MDRRKNLMFYLVIVIMVASMTLSIFSCIFQIRRIADRTSEESMSIASLVGNLLENSFLSPLVVSETMCRDYNLRQHFLQSAENPQELYEDEIAAYLRSIRDGFGYQMVFAVSDATRAYYTYNGISKFVDYEQDDHDIWYKAFLDMGKHYDLDVDTDEANHWNMAVFVNTRLESEDGQFLGVCGVAVEMNELQQKLLSYEKTYNIKINLIDENGLIQVDTDTARIERDYLPIPKTQKGECMQDFTYYRDGNSSFEVRYIDALDWYLVVEDLQPEKLDVLQIVTPSIMIFVVGLSLLGIIFWLIRSKEKRLMKLSLMDSMTGLYNRRALDMDCEAAGSDIKDRKILFADLNGLKNINDSLGHKSGDEIIIAVAEGLKQCFGSQGKAYRIGGDEFVVMLTCEEDKIRQCLDAFDAFTESWKGSEGQKLSVSKSLVASCDYPECSLQELLEIADRKMYEDKLEYYRRKSTRRRW